MTYDHSEMLCDGCGRAVFGRFDDDTDSIRRRAAERGWIIFEAKDLCPGCAEKWTCVPETDVPDQLGSGVETARPKVASNEPPASTRDWTSRDRAL